MARKQDGLIVFTKVTTSYTCQY